MRKNGTPISIEEEDDLWSEETPHEQVVRKELTELVELHLNQLKIEYREVLVLRQYDKLSYAEIAAITGVTVSSVESRLFKARKALAKKLAPFFKEL
jgi:RNA polymerase sigma-70 factor (ECF subfamily)